MDSSATDAYSPTAFDHLLYFFYDLSAAGVAIGTLALIAAAVWLGRKALAYYRIIHAIRTAPRVAVSSGAAGLVKVVGEAQPGSPVPEGFAKPRHVWRETSRLDTRSSRSLDRRRTYSVAPIVVRDASGDCVINPLKAVVVHDVLRGSVQPHFGNDATYYTERVILTGAPVFAIGVIGRAKKRPAEGGVERCTMRQDKNGVLLLSAKSEARTRLRFERFFWPALAGCVFCAVLAGWMFDNHLGSYPNQSLAEYGEALITRPWVINPGQNRGPAEDAGGESATR